jgi:hypothetical protein
MEPHEIKYFYSGGGTNFNPSASLGGAISQYEVIGSLHSLFDWVTGPEAAAGSINYRCIYVRNINTTTALENTELWLVDSVGGASISVGVEASPPLVANESTAPSGVIFSSPTQESPLQIGTIAPEGYTGIWLKREILPNTSPLANDSVLISIRGDSFA